MLHVASITASLVTFATHVIQHLGLGGVCLLIVMSQVVIVPGTEATMLFAGFSVYEHHLTMLGIIFFGVLGDVIGATICYLIGYFGLHEVLGRYGALHVDERRLELAHRWFERFGAPVVAVSRLIPLFRSAPPYAAGIAKMSYPKFLAMAALGSIVWISAWSVVGDLVGSQWSQWKNHLDYVDYAVIAIIVLAVAWWVVRRLRTARTVA